jgi:hypothetical protein
MRRSRTTARPCLLEPLEARQLLTGAINAALSFGNLGDDLITGLAVDSQNIAYITGTFTGTVDMDPRPSQVTLTSKGGTDVFIAAYQFGELLWAQSFGSTGDEAAGGLVLSGDGLVVAGNFFTTMDIDPGSGTNFLVNNTGVDAFVARFSTGGNFQAAFSFGGNGFASADRLASDAAGNLYLRGSFSGTVDFDPGNGTTSRTTPTGDIHHFVARYGPAGSFAWVKTFAVEGTLQGPDLAVTPAGIPILAGSFNGTLAFDAATVFVSGPGLGFVAVLTAAGEIDWVETYGRRISGTFDPIQVATVAVDPTGNILIGGRFSGTIDIDPSDDVIPISNPPPVLQPPADHAFAGFILKLDPVGNYLWSGSFLGGASLVADIAADSGGNLLLVGEMEGSTDFDFRNGETHLVSSPNSQPNEFFAKYDSAGRFLIVTTPETSTGTSRATLVATGPDFRAAVAGFFSNSLAIETTSVNNLPVVGDTVLVSRGAGDAFLLQFAPLRLQPTIALNSSSTSVLRGEGFILSASVGGKVPASGKVRFFDGPTLVGEATLDASGLAVLPLALTAAGAHVFTAVYGGDPNFESRTSTLITVTVIIPETPVGSIDLNDGGYVSGWAGDYQAINTPVVLQFFIDGFMRKALVADDVRPDLQSFFGSTNHGYTYRLPPLEAGSHSLMIVAFDPITGAGSILATATVASDNLYFDEAWYRQAYPDVTAAITSGILRSGWQHFSASGAHESRNPSPYFNETWYRAQYADVGSAVAQGAIPSGFFHFANTGTREGRDPSANFSESFYLRAYEDVNLAVFNGMLVSGFSHFLLAGAQENRSPTPWFEGPTYPTRHPDVMTAIQNGTVRFASEHFLISGIAELRSPSPVYDEAAYLARYPDVAAAVNGGALDSGLAHYLAAGYAEGRITATTFDSAAYLAAHPEAQAAINTGMAVSAFDYFLRFGRMDAHQP